VGVLVAPVAWKFALQDYQKERISTFLDPSQDAKGAGYQQIQARITVGSGGVWGQGFPEGDAALLLAVLPAAHIRPSSSRPGGGCTALAGVLVALWALIFSSSARARGGRSGQGSSRLVLVLGVLASFTFQVVYNITMSAAGAGQRASLPLMSYGGSSMIATLAGSA
jgi:rod shape determining protein RodA